MGKKILEVTCNHFVARILGAWRGFVLCDILVKVKQASSSRIKAGTIPLVISTSFETRLCIIWSFATTLIRWMFLICIPTRTNANQLEGNVWYSMQYFWAKATLWRISKFLWIFTSRWNFFSREKQAKKSESNKFKRTRLTSTLNH